MTSSVEGGARAEASVVCFPPVAMPTAASDCEGDDDAGGHRRRRGRLRGDRGEIFKSGNTLAIVLLFAILKKATRQFHQRLNVLHCRGPHAGLGEGAHVGKLNVSDISLPPPTALLRRGLV